MRPLESLGNSVSTSFKPTTAIAGIGGWLLLLIVRLWIGTAVRLIGGFAAGFSLLGLFSFGSVALSGAAALLLGFKNAKGVLIAKIFLAADAIYYSLALIDFLLGSDSQVSSSMPPWFQPSGYLIASVLWLVYLIRSRRVKNTYFPAVMQVDTEDEQVPSGRHGWAEMAEPSRQANAIHEHVPPHVNTLLARSDFEEIKTKLVNRVDERLREMVNNPADKYRDYVDLLKQHGDADKIEIIRRHQLSVVTALCEHAYSVHLSPSVLHIPDVPDSNGSFPKELQRWAIAVSIMGLFRALDIRAAMEVNKPFELMIEDRDYLLAIVRKNAGNDGTSIGKMDATEYETASGPEIAYKLMIQASCDMFVSEMWAYVAHYAGDEDFLTRYEKGGSIAAGKSLEYWVGFAPSQRT